MPYTKPESQKYIKEGGDPRDVGELNLKITFEMITRWQAHPRYETIHSLRRDFSTRPEENEWLRDFWKLNQRFAWKDVMAASQEAYHEFRDRVGRLYENMKADMNGDVYADVLKPLRDQYSTVRMGPSHGK